VDEQGTVICDFFEIYDEVVRVLRVGQRLGREECDDVVRDYVYGLVCEIVFLTQDKSQTIGRQIESRGEHTSMPRLS